MLPHDPFSCRDQRAGPMVFQEIQPRRQALAAKIQNAQQVAEREWLLSKVARSKSTARSPE